VPDGPREHRASCNYHTGNECAVGRSMERLGIEVSRVLTGPRKSPTVPPLWDGHTAERIAEAVMNWQR